MRHIFLCILCVFALITVPVSLAQGRITRPSTPIKHTRSSKQNSTSKKSSTIKTSPTVVPTKTEPSEYNVKKIHTASDTVKVTEFKILPDAVKDEDNTIFIEVEQKPEFPGGQAALFKYLGEHLRYPEDAAEQGIEGRVVVQFVVTKNGKIENVKVIRGKNPSLDAEALRVVRSLPNFKPGKSNGEPVNCNYTLPITFRLQN